MRCILIIVVFLSVTTNIYNQETRIKVLKHDPDIKEYVSVLKSNSKVKHGPYVMTANNDTIQKGYYTSNIRSGIWDYRNGNKTEFRYDYDKKQIETDTLGKSRRALFSEGVSYFNYLIAINNTYPWEDAFLGLQGTVFVKFKVDVNGNPKEFQIDLGCGSVSLNEAALKAVKAAATKFPWYPAIDNKGELIESTLSWPVFYRIA